MKHVRAFQVVIIISLFLLSFSGCSGGSDETDGDTSPDGDRTETPQPVDGDTEIDVVDGDLDAEPDAAETPDGDVTEQSEEDADLDLIDGDLEPDSDPEPENPVDGDLDMDCDTPPAAVCFQNGEPGQSGTRCGGSTLLFCEPRPPAPPACLPDNGCNCQVQQNCELGCEDIDRNGHARCIPASDGDLEPETFESDDDLELDESDGDFFEIEEHVIDGDLDWEADDPACLNDTYEPNESRGESRMVYADDELDLSICPSDLDWFAVSLPAGGSLTARIEFDNDQANLNLFLLNDQDDYEVISSSSSHDYEQVEFSGHGEYYLFVYAAGGGSVDYHLSVQIDVLVDGDIMEQDQIELEEVDPDKDLIEIPTCDDDRLEPNDSLESAQVISAVRYDDLTVCPENDDYYVISLEQQDFVTLDLSFVHLQGNLDLYLYKSTGSVYLTSYSTTDNEQIQFWATEAGTYYIRVFSPSDDENQYSLEVTVESSQACSDDRFEANDRMQDAADGSDIQAQDEFKLCPYNVDWYAFDLQAGQSLQLDVLFTHSNGDIDAVLYDSGMQPLDVGDSLSDNERLIHYAEAARTVYAQIYAAKGRLELSYDLQVQIVNEQLCNNDAFEDNNQFAQAALLPEEGVYDELQLCRNEEDWYSLSLATNDILTISVHFPTTVPAAQVMLFDSNQIPMTGASATEDGYELTRKITQNGTYALWIRPQVAIETAYSLDVNICPEDDFEPNDDIYSSTILQPPVDIPGLNICKGNEDWYALAPEAGRTALISLIFQHSQGDLDLYLRDGYGDVVARSTSTSNNEAIIFLAPNSATYYLQVTGYSGAENNYQLIYELDD